MTESDYILATNAARLRAARDLLQQVIPSEHAPEAQLMAARHALASLEEATVAAIREQDRAEKKR